MKAREAFRITSFEEDHHAILPKYNIYFKTKKEIEVLLELWDSAKDLKAENKRLKEALINMVFETRSVGWQYAVKGSNFRNALDGAEQALKENQ